MKKLALLSLFLISLNAKIVDRVVASVENEPITSYEISQTMKKHHFNKYQALNYLIDQKLLDAEIKKRGIEVDDFDVQNAMQEIANKNGFTLLEFKSLLQSRGELESFEKKLKENLLKQKLFEQIVSSKLKISPEEIKSYYQNHKKDFSVFKTVQVTEYIANNPQILNQIKQNPLENANVTVKNMVFGYKDLPKNLLYLFESTKVGQYTPILNDGMNYVMYYIARKDGKVVLPFSEVKDIIANKLLALKREEILNSYFSRLKNQSNIKIYK